MASGAVVFSIPLRDRFRGVSVREGVIWRGRAGTAEWSPFLEYGGEEILTWWQAAHEAAEVGWPPPVRSAVPVNCTVPALAPDRAYALAAGSGCATAKVKVAEPGQSLADDLARVEAVRAALGPAGKVRVDANGGWSVTEAVRALRALNRFDLEYAEQPCARVTDLAELRTTIARLGVDVPIAADESIRRVSDPYQVSEMQAADIAVLKVQPMGGVRACLEVADRIGMPVVVSSAVETSVGIRAGLALAAALPELPYACGLNTVPLLVDDLATSPLVAINGVLQVRDVVVDEAAVTRCSADRERTAFWQARLVQTLERQRTRRG